MSDKLKLILFIVGNILIIVFGVWLTIKVATSDIPLWLKFILLK